MSQSFRVRLYWMLLIGGLAVLVATAMGMREGLVTRYRLHRLASGHLETADILPVDEALLRLFSPAARLMLKLSAEATLSDALEVMEVMSSVRVSYEGEGRGPEIGPLSFGLLPASEALRLFVDEARKRSGLQLAIAVSDDGTIVVAEPDRLQDAVPARWYDIDGILDQEIRIGFPFMERGMHVDDERLIAFLRIWSRETGAKRTAIKGALVTNRELFMWGNLKYHEKVDRALEQLKAIVETSRRRAAAER